MGGGDDGVTEIGAGAGAGDSGDFGEVDGRQPASDNPRSTTDTVRVTTSYSLERRRV
jgi:hypothetical protein